MTVIQGGVVDFHVEDFHVEDFHVVNSTLTSQLLSQLSKMQQRMPCHQFVSKQQVSPHEILKSSVPGTFNCQ